MDHSDWTDEDIEASIEYLRKNEFALSDEDRYELIALRAERDRRVEGVTRKEQRERVGRATVMLYCIVMGLAIIGFILRIMGCVD